MARELWIADVLADAFRGVRGFQVDVVPGYGTRGSTDFSPIGLINHHTGAGGYDNLLNYMAYNAPTAPLCNWATSRPYNGVVRITIVAAGRANHAGQGGAGRGGTSWIPTDQGNKYAIGGEHQNDGSQAWPGQQVDAIHIGSAALLKHMGLNEGRVALHKTYAPGRKSDQHTITLGAQQTAIREILRGTAPAPEPPTPAPIVLEDEDMLTFIKNAANGRIYLVGRGYWNYIETQEQIDVLRAKAFVTTPTQLVSQREYDVLREIFTNPGTDA